MAKSRRPRGSGSYDKIIDKKGNVLYRWRIGIFDPTIGKTAYKSIKSRSRAALDEKVKAWKEENGGGNASLISPNRMTVKQWVERWLASLVDKVSQSTLENYKNTATFKIIPNLGTLWLDKVSPLMLQTYFDELSKTHAPSSVVTIRAHFRACFSKAVKFNLLSQNPVISTNPPKNPKPDLKILEEDEVKRILEVAKDYSYQRHAEDEGDKYVRKCRYLIILLAAASGMRRGELLGLTWPCIHDTQIEVKYSLQTLNGDKRKLKSPKNGKSRLVAIPKTVAEELQKWRKYQEAYAEKYKGFYENPLSLVFTSKKGTPVVGGNFSHREFQIVCAAAGVKGARFHDLRHFWASSVLSKGIPVQIVSEQLGHSSIEITYNRYTHVLQKSRDELRALLDGNSIFASAKEKEDKQEDAQKPIPDETPIGLGTYNSLSINSLLKNGEPR